MEGIKCKKFGNGNKNGKLKYISYLIGTEIETTIEGHTCDTCDYCAICDNCPVCGDCQENRYYCDNCDSETRENIIYRAWRHGYITEEEAEELKKDLDNDGICDICQRFELWRDTICPYCHPCYDCEYYRNPEYCPYDDYGLPDFVDFDKIEPYIDRYYEDGSCGLEFPTKAFDNLKDYYNAIKTIVSVIGKDYIKTTYNCGGHINISWENIKTGKTHKDYEFLIAKNIIFFSDLLSYMFNSKYTYCRYEWSKMPNYYEDIDDFIISKSNYPLVLLKTDRIEVRFPDAVNSPNNHTLLTAVLLAISFYTKQCFLNEKSFETTVDIYDTIRYHGKTPNKKQQSILKDKFILLKRIVKPYLKEFSYELNVDLVKALDWRFKNPRFTTMKRLNFKMFSMDKRIKLETIATTIQKPLMAFC